MIWDSSHDCDLAAARYFHVVKDQWTAVQNPKSCQNEKVTRCHVGHTTISYRPLSTAVMSRKFTIVREKKRCESRQEDCDIETQG